MPQSRVSTEYKWSCCSCLQHGGMDTQNTLFCPNFNCSHPRCGNCIIEEVKRVKIVASGGETSLSKPLGSSAHHSSKIAPNPTHEVNTSKAPRDLGGPIGDPKSYHSQFKKIAEGSHPKEKELELPTPQPPTRLENAISLENETLQLEDILMRPRWRTRSLIPLVAAEEEGDPIYPLDAVKDALLLDQWNKVILPTINAEPDEFKGYNAIHLFRQGHPKSNSRLTIMVSMEDSTGQGILHKQLSRLIVPPLRSNCQILFEESAIRRTVKAQLPPICEPRNIGYTLQPDFGASVGLKGNIDSTATLGGYLVVDNRLLLMTVDHLVGDNDIPPVLLTHPSEQEALFSKYWPMLENALNLLKECCICCQTIYREHCRPERCYSPISESSLPSRCEISSSFRDTKEFLVKACPRETFGSLVCRSTTRSRPSQVNDKYNTEMDWALFHTDQWPESLGLQANEKARNLRFSEIIPGAKVTATGRTSGSQLGIINTAMSIIRHSTRITQEWSVLRDPSSTLEDWIKGGIGVDGDSGAWILDRESGAIYGMAWGRNHPTTKPICLFSPIEDIVADIKERTGAIEVCLPSQDRRAIRTTPTTEHQLKREESTRKRQKLFH